MKKLIIGSFLAALALFVWGGIYFGASGLPYKFLGPAGEYGPALNAAFPADGTYIMPDPRGDYSAGGMPSGPFAVVHIKKDASDLGSAGLMIKGFLHGWGYCILLGLLLGQICQKSGYCARVGFCALAGLAGAFAARLGDPIWWPNSWAWELSNFAYAVVGATVAGLVLAKFIKPAATRKS